MKCLFRRLQEVLERFIERVLELLDAESTPGKEREKRATKETRVSIQSIQVTTIRGSEAGSTTGSVEGLGPDGRRLDRISTGLVERVDLDRRTRDRSSPDPGSGLPYEPAARRASRTGSCFCSIAAVPSLSRPADAPFRVPPGPQVGPPPLIKPP